MSFQLKIIIYLLLFATCFTSCKTKRQVIWEENFDGDSLNEAHWNFEEGNGCPELCGWGNNELQVYTKQNHIVKDGFLKITAKLQNETYTSTRITTKGKHEFQYGKMELRA